MGMSLFTPNGLPQALDAVSRDMAQSRDYLRQLVEALVNRGGDPPEAETRILGLSSGGPATWYTSEQMRIVGAVLSTDSGGRYGLSVGSDTSLWWRVPPNTPQNLGFSPERQIVVARGLALTVSVPSGLSPNWDLLIWWYSGDLSGRVAK